MRRAARVRVGQFFAVLQARADPPDCEPARLLLPPNLCALFGEMPPEDRRHGLQVVSILQEGGATDEHLLQAGLLHDVGKANSGVGIPHRILRVLLATTVPRVWGWFAGRPTGWHRPFWVITNHPERGAVWIESVDADSEVVELVRHHESDAPHHWRGTGLDTLHEALAAADAQC